MTAEIHQELSERELEILELVSTGATNQQVAQALYISPNTVKTHLSNIYSKLEVESRTEATLYAIQHGLIQVQTPEGAETDAQDTVSTSPVEIAERKLIGNRDNGLPATWQSIVLLGALILSVLVMVWSGPRPIGANAAIDTRLVDMGVVAPAEQEKEANSRWQDRAQMPSPRGRFAQAQVDGLIYVISGVTDDGLTTDVRVYDAIQDVWTPREAKPTAAANIGAAVIGGLVYVPGGLDTEGQPLDLLEIYDPSTDQWFEGPRLPTALCAYAMVPYGQGFYLLGGWDGDDYLDVVYFYDALDESWHFESTLSIPRGFAAAALVDGRIYLVGGYDGTAEYRTVESYDPEMARAGQNAWRTHAPMHSGRAGHAMVQVLGNLYVLGGGWASPFESGERYDVAKDIWTTFESPIVGEWRTLGASSIETSSGTYIYTLGGWAGSYLSAVKAYQAFFRIYLP